MMNEQYREFGTRIRKIDRRHRRLAEGFVTSVNHDGLIIAVPKRRRVRVPFAGIALLAIGVIALKGLIHAQLGESSYQQRLASLEAGSTVEQAGAWVMQADPLTLWVSQQVRSLGR
jgi:hypothetical protein